MSSFYYVIELMLITSVPIFNAFGINVPYWTIALIFGTHIIQISFENAKMKSLDNSIKETMGILNDLKSKFDPKPSGDGVKLKAYYR